MEDQTGSAVRAISRHSLSYILCLISEMLRTYDLDTISLLLIHTILNANVINIMRNPDLDRRYARLEDVEPDAFKRGISRAALARFLNMPTETVRRRVNFLKKQNILVETETGLIVTEANQYRFGNNESLQKINLQLLRKLKRDIASSGMSIEL